MSNDQNTAIKENLYEKYEIVQVNDADSSFNKWYQIRDENNNVAMLKGLQQIVEQRFEDMCQ